MFYDINEVKIKELIEKYEYLLVVNSALMQAAPTSRNMMIS